MTYHEKLDMILRVLLRNLPTYITQKEVEGKISKRILDDHMWLEIHLILNKLIEDGYCKKYLIPIVNINTNESVNTEHFEITFKGKIFIQEGGYVGNFQRLESQKIQADEYRTHQMHLQTKLNRLTCWIAVGTVVAAIYYTIEILKYFCVLPKTF